MRIFTALAGVVAVGALVAAPFVFGQDATPSVKKGKPDACCQAKAAKAAADAKAAAKGGQCCKAKGTAAAGMGAGCGVGGGGACGMVAQAGYVIGIDGMMCEANCPPKVVKALSEMDTVATVKVDFAKKLVRVTTKDGKPLSRMIATKYLLAAGFTVTSWEGKAKAKSLTPAAPKAEKAGS